MREAKENVSSERVKLPRIGNGRVYRGRACN